MTPTTSPMTSPTMVSFVADRPPGQGSGGGGGGGDDDHENSAIANSIGVVYLAVLVAIPFYVVSMVVGLNLALTSLLAVAFALTTGWVHRRRLKRRPNAYLGGPGSVSLSGLLGALIVFLFIQLVPYGHSHGNPAAVSEPRWPDAETKHLAQVACFDCHSNETHYPWYSSIAPASWLVTDHVSQGRAALNFSDLATGRANKNEVIDVIRQGVMPPYYYTALGMHPAANLSKAEQEKLIEGLSKMTEFRKRSLVEGDISELPAAG